MNLKLNLKMNKQTRDEKTDISLKTYRGLHEFNKFLLSR